jgi:FAD/FMN-containing dehydrogenase
MDLTDRLKQIVGGQGFLDSPDVLDQFSRDVSFVKHIRPRCVVRPGNSDAVQGIIRLACESKTPIVPVSSGAPRFRGDTVPGIGGAVVMDLSAMKQIIRIERKNRVAMIEAGVTFEELIPALKKEGLRLNMPLPPRRSKSVIGSMLEREPVTMPVFQWDAQDPLLCTEVYFGTGDRFRTGSAAGPGTI